MNGEIKNGSGNVVPTIKKMSAYTDPNAVHYKPDTKTEVQKEQARQNIGAADAKTQAAHGEQLTEHEKTITEHGEEVAEHDVRMTQMEARMNTFASLQDGSTTGDAEIADIRVGYDGKTYPTAGEAVRGQVGKLTEEIDAYNCTSLFVARDIDGKENAGIIWTCTDDIIEVSGTATGLAALNLYNESTKVPEGFTNGKRVNITFEKTGTNTNKLNIELYKYDVDGSLTLMKSVNGSQFYTVPSDFDGVGLLIRLRVENEATLDVRAKVRILSTLTNDQLYEEIHLTSTNDSTDRANEINRLLAVNGHVKLGVGVFYASAIVVPKGATLEGCGNLTQLIHDKESYTLIFASSESTIKNLRLIGSYESQPEQGAFLDMNEIGIYAGDGSTENLIIENCFISGFSWAGIMVKDTGTPVRSVLISNCDVKYCRIGLSIDNSEYACVTNCVFRDNFIGVQNYGGNNKFSCCGFDSNGWGFIVGGTNNNGHGSAVGCSFNHNDVNAIYMEKVYFGYIFSGCQVHDGCIRIDDKSKGTLFNGCNFGNKVILSKSGTHPAYCVGSTFSTDPKENAEYQNTDNSLRFINCFNFNTGEII